MPPGLEMRFVGHRFEPLGDRARDLELDQLFDVDQVFFLVGAEQRDRVTFRTGTSGTADAMHVILGRMRQLVVDHAGHFLDVEAARGDVGGDQQFDFTALELVESGQPLALRLVAMDRVGFQALLFKVPR